MGDPPLEQACSASGHLEPPLSQLRLLGAGPCPACPPELLSLIKVSLAPCHLPRASGCSISWETSPFLPWAQQGRAPSAGVRGWVPASSCLSGAGVGGQRGEAH